MDFYNKIEIERIAKAADKNEKMEDFFNERRTEWNDKLEPLYSVLKLDFTDSNSVKKVLDCQSYALSYRQMIHENINVFVNKRGVEDSKLKTLKYDKFMFYATGFGIKTNLSEKGILIDAHLAENERAINIIDSYIQFLRDTNKVLESLGFSIKNMIELLNYLGK